MEPRNLGEQSYWGFSVSQALRLLPGWNLTLSGNAYYLNNQMAFDAQRYYQRKRWAGNFSLQTSFPLFWGIRSEVLGIYLTKRLGGSTEVMNPTGCGYWLSEEVLSGKSGCQIVGIRYFLVQPLGRRYELLRRLRIHQLRLW